MAGGKLTVQIGADITDFEKKIKEVEFDIKELSKVKLDKLKLGLDTTEINAQIKDAKNNLNQLRTTVKDTGNQISGQFTKQVANGGNTLLQFSRIAQDAPFGIIGIGNNLTATAESFSYLKQQTGSTGGALKALASSIAGTGGILLGVSLLTTGLTLMAQSGLSVNDVVNKLTGNFDEFGAALNKISVDAAKSSGQEIAGLQALVSVAQDDTNARKDRLLAIDELQSKYPAYFGNLSKEQILTGDLTSVTKELSKAIIARAEATAIADKIGELASKKLDLQIKKEKEILNLQKAQANAKFVFTGGSTIGADASISNQTRLARATSNVKELNQDILDIQIQQDKLAGRLNQKTEESIKLLEKKAGKETKSFLTPQVSSLSNTLPVAPNVEFDFLPIFTALEAVPNKVNEELLRIQLLLNEFNLAVNDLIQNSIATTFANLGTAIGDALVSGGDVLSAIGSTLIQALAGFLSQLGDKLIQYGLLLAAFGKAEAAFIAGDPVTKIGAGLAMVALGIAVKAASGAVGASARTSGGGGGGSTGAGANNQSFSSSGFTSAGNGGGTVVFEIAGQKLIGVLSNTINANKRLGGQLGLG